MRNISVSIIVPVFNAEPYLNRCLESLVNQTQKDIEIILVNDGSKDNSGAICNTYATKDSRLSVIHQKNLGQTRARIEGIRKARGEFVHFVDADDWIDIRMEEIMYTKAKECNADIITCDSVFHKGKKEILARQIFSEGVYGPKKLISTIYPRMIYSGKFFYFGIHAAMWNKLFRRELIQKNIETIDPAVRIGEDGLATYASFLDARKVVVIKDTLYHYRDDNNTSITRSYCWEQFDSALLLVVYLRRIAKRNIKRYDINSQIDMYLLYNIKSIIREEFYYKTKRTYRRRYQYLRRIVTHPLVQESCERVLSEGSLTEKDARFFRLISSRNFHSLVGQAVYRGIEQKARLYSRKLAYSNKLSMLLFDSTQKIKSAASEMIKGAAAAE